VTSSCLHGSELPKFNGIALWVAMTHCFDLFDFAAYLIGKSAEKRSGKTRTQDVNGPMSGLPIVATGLKLETAFRMAQKFHPTRDRAQP
jgi:hypothetical protein